MEFYALWRWQKPLVAGEVRRRRRRSSLSIAAQGDPAVNLQDHDHRSNPHVDLDLPVPLDPRSVAIGVDAGHRLGRRSGDLRRSTSELYPKIPKNHINSRDHNYIVSLV